ncbi:MAG TPA: aldehyde dehydrogenase family protein, partial [Myxococcota bacterium]|nr:aldehyde dehydrogenase family protein [Myxococcota bacterium]
MGYDVRAHINGEWVDGPTADNLNPADSEARLGTYPKLSRPDTEAAIAAAEAAFPAWRAMPAPQRGKILTRALSLFDARREEIARALTLEEGKILSEAQGEVQKAYNVLEFAIAEGRRMGGHTIPSEMPSTFAYTVRQPLGVVALITPWNFPVAIPMWKLAPALIAGNTVVFKPASLTPWTAELLVRVFVDAGLPKGVLNMVTGGGATVGDALVSDPRVRAISFTGSNDVGLHLYGLAAKRGARVQCEMGGKNPLVVLDDADLDMAALATAQGAFGSTGQRCTATSRAIVQAAVADAFVERVVAHARQVVAGSGLDPKVTMGPSVDGGQLCTVLDYVAIGDEEGAKRLCGGERLTDGALGRGFFPAPTVFDYVRPGMRIAQEEIFGPVLSVLRVETYDEAVALVNANPYGNGVAIFTGSGGAARK